MPSSRARAIAVAYVAALAAIAVGADAGVLGGLVTWVHEIPFGDKVGHFALTFGLGILAEWALRARGRALGWLLVAVNLEELSQLVIPGRSFDLGDAAANSLGLVCGTLCAVALTRAERPADT